MNNFFKSNEYNELHHFFENNLIDSISKLETKEFAEAAHYFISDGGKRVRPILAMLFCGVFNQNPKDSLYSGIAIELMHNFTLVHDDVMDESNMRRGKQTVHKKWNVGFAILLGDIIQAYAYNLLPKSEAHYSVFSEFLQEVCIGQAYDLMFTQKSNIVEADYIKMISLKTGSLLRCSAKLGAIDGGANADKIDIVDSFALNLGISFQIKDDYLDIFANVEKLGKKIGGDILEKKKTILVIKAKELATDPSDIEILNKLDTNLPISDSEIPKFRELFSKLGVDIYTEKLSTEYFEKAMNVLHFLPQNKYTEMLKELAVTLNSRDY